MQKKYPFFFLGHLNRILGGSKLLGLQGNCVPCLLGTTRTTRTTNYRL